MLTDDRPMADHGLRLLAPPINLKDRGAAVTAAAARVVDLLVDNDKVR